MGTIKTVTKYKFDGEEYRDLGKVQIEVINRIGLVVDEIVQECPPAKIKDVRNILKVLTKPKNRVKLTELLNITFETDEYNLNNTETNILDL